MEALRRVKAATVEKRLLDKNGVPAFQLLFYVLTKKGEYAGVAMWALDEGKPERFAVCTESGPELLTVEPLHEGAPAE
jgi:N4-(beta-N-acetylglucosaminyl)-L-asparaginase